MEKALIEKVKFLFIITFKKNINVEHEKSIWKLAYFLLSYIDGN